MKLRVPRLLLVSLLTLAPVVSGVRLHAEEAPARELVIPTVEAEAITLGGLVSFLKTQGSVSYMLAREAADYPVPDFIMKDATPLGLLQAVSTATQGDVLVSAQPTNPAKADSPIAVLISLTPKGRERVSPLRETRVYVFLREFADTAAFEAHAALVAKAQAAGEAVARFPTSSGGAELKTFPEGNLLFARGTREQLELLDRLIQAFQGKQLVKNSSP